MTDEHGVGLVVAVGVLAATQGCSVASAINQIDLTVLELDEPPAHVAAYVRRFGELP